MKRVFGFALTALVLLVFAVPSAFAMRVRLDPGNDPPPVVLTNLLPGDLGQPISVAWQACTNNGIPTNLNADGYIACLALNNLTGVSISSLTFAFTVPASLNGQSLDCSNDGVFLASSTDCPTGTLTTGQLVSFGYSGLPPIGTSHDFFLGADGLANVADYPNITVTASVPEPGEIGLFGLGLLIIGVMGYGAQRRRRGSRVRTRAS